MKKIKKKFKNFIKALSTNNFVQSVIALLIVFLIKIIFLTCKSKIFGKKYIKEYKKKTFIGCMWHGRSMGCLILTKKHLNGNVITSKHRDGRIMSKVLEYFGLNPIYGSTTSGAISVLRVGLNSLKNNESLLLTPDGPKGPRMRVKEGAIYFAKMSGCPLVPVCFSCKRGIWTNFWDRYLIVTPFSRVFIEIGEPFYVPKNTDNSKIEVYRKRFEKIMIDQQNRLDNKVGRNNIFPESQRKLKRRSF